MQIIDDINQVLSLLDKIDSEYKELPDKLSRADLQLSDIYHFIENNNLSARGCCRIVKLLKSVLSERRAIKMEKAISMSFNSNKNKLVNEGNRSILTTSINQLAKNWLTEDYKYSVLSEEEIKKYCEGD